MKSSMNCLRYCIAFLLLSAPLLRAQIPTATAPIVPDWALPDGPGHRQVPPPADFARASVNFDTPIGIFDGQSDIGSALVPGSSSYNTATRQYTLTSAGYNIWYTRDEFRYLWKKMSGDVSLAADVSFPDPKGYSDRKAVLVIRQSLDDDSKEAMIGQHGGGLIHLAQRPERHAMMIDAQFRFGGTLAKITAKRIGIEKRGDSIAIFISLTGEPMHQLGPPITLHFDGPFYVGIGFTSHLPVTPDTAVLSNVVLENTAGRLEMAQVMTASSARTQQQLRSHLFIYDLRDGSTHQVYSADGIWEAPNWSPDGSYLISNSNNGLYKFMLKPDGTAEPQKLAIPAEYRINNDKAISPDGKRLAFSATLPPGRSSQVFLADADGSNARLMVSPTPSYFHGWSPDGKILAFVAQRNNSGQYDVYRIPAAGGAEEQLNSNVHHDDGPDYSPDGRWLYINSDRSGKEAIWRFPASGAGPNDAKAEMVVSDAMEDWFPHISPDGKKMVYIGYPTGTATHDPRNAAVQIKLVTIANGKVAATSKTLVEATGGQGTLNVNSWAPDSMRFAYISYEALP